MKRLFINKKERSELVEEVKQRMIDVVISNAAIRAEELVDKIDNLTNQEYYENIKINQNIRINYIIDLCYGDIAQIVQRHRRKNLINRNRSIHSKRYRKRNVQINR